MTTSIVIATTDGFVGAQSLGELRSDIPLQFAYCYDNIEEADKVARSLGLSDYMLGSADDFRWCQ
jgi:hypothetical protein